MSHTWKKKFEKKIDFVAFSSWKGHSGDWKILPSDLQVKTKDHSYKYYPKDLIDPIANSITTTTTTTTTTQVPKTSVNLDGDVREKFMCPPSILT